MITVKTFVNNNGLWNAVIEELDQEGRPIPLGPGRLQWHIYRGTCYGQLLDEEARGVATAGAIEHMLDHHRRVNILNLDCGCESLVLTGITNATKKAEAVIEKEERAQFSTGSVRSQLDHIRYDLISREGLRRLAKTYAEGAVKYGDHNWRKGQPWSAVLNHLLNHIHQWASKEETGEDHLAHAAWGLFALMEFEKSHPELDDLQQIGRDDDRREVDANDSGHGCGDGVRPERTPAPGEVLEGGALHDPRNQFPRWGFG